MMLLLHVIMLILGRKLEANALGHSLHHLLVTFVLTESNIIAKKQLLQTANMAIVKSFEEQCSASQLTAQEEY